MGNIEVFVLLLVAHVLGDFYLQDDKTARKKAASRSVCFKHCLLYALIQGALFALLWMQSPMTVALLQVWMLLSVTHALIDFVLRPLILKHVSSELAALAIDQFAHIVMCVVGCHLLCSQLQLAQVGHFGHTALIWIASLLLSWFPGRVVVKTVLSGMRAGLTEEESSGPGSLRSGSIVGVLERTLVCALTLLGQFDAIAFVIAAKSIARFEMLNDRDFAEIYLVGTLVSVTWAMSSALLISFILS